MKVLRLTANKLTSEGLRLEPGRGAPLETLDLGENKLRATPLLSRCVVHPSPELRGASPQSAAEGVGDERADARLDHFWTRLSAGPAS